MVEIEYATGTWFQPFGEVDYPDTLFNKDAKYWHKEFEYMKKLKFDTFIFQFAAHNNISYYNSKNFKVKNDILSIVEKEIWNNKFDFILGLYLNSKYYKTNNFKDILEEQYKKSVLVFDELFEKYKNFLNLKYWYIPQEIDAYTFKKESKKKELFNFINKIIQYIKYKSNLPIMISPYFSIQDIREFKTWWSDFFSNVYIDVIAMQDGMGCFRNIKLSDVSLYYTILQELCSKHNVKFWSTLEIFQFINAPELNNKSIKIIPAKIDRIKQQIKINAKFVDKIIFFEFAHFLSPQFSYKSKKLYKQYLNYLLENL